MSEPFDLEKFAAAHGMQYHRFELCPVAWFVPIKYTLWHINNPPAGESVLATNVLAVVPNTMGAQASAFSAYTASVAHFPATEAEAAFVAYCLFNGG